MNILDLIDGDAMLGLKFKAEPAEGGAIVSLFIPKELGPLVPGLLVAGSLQSTDKSTDAAIAVFGKQLMNALLGKHSDDKGNAIETATKREAP